MVYVRKFSIKDSFSYLHMVEEGGGVNPRLGIPRPRLSTEEESVEVCREQFVPHQVSAEWADSVTNIKTRM